MYIFLEQSGIIQISQFTLKKTKDLTRVTLKVALFWGMKPCVFFFKIYGRSGSCLRHCATSRQVAGSIRDGVIGIFH
jgi:hypothetical protein